MCKEKDVMGYWLCPAEKEEFNTECAALRSGREVTMACGEGYSGECTGNRCPVEEQSAVMWAVTDSMETATASWVSGLGAGFACVWGDDDRRGGVPGICCRHTVPSGVSCGFHGLIRACMQRQDREELRAHHVSGGLVRGRDVARDGGRLDGGALVGRGRGGRFDARVQRERRVVVRGVGRGLLLPADGGGGARHVHLRAHGAAGDGGEGMCDDVRGHDSVHVLAGRFVDGAGEGVRAHHVPRRDDGGFVLPDDGEHHDARASVRGGRGGFWLRARVRRERRVERVFVPGGGGARQRRQRVFDGGGEPDVRCEHDGLCVAFVFAVRRVIGMCKHVQACASMCKHVQACASMCKHVQGSAVSGGAAERVRVAGDEQLDGGASAVQRVHDGLRVAHVRSDGRVERA